MRSPLVRCRAGLARPGGRSAQGCARAARFRQSKRSDSGIRQSHQGPAETRRSLLQPGQRLLRPWAASASDQRFGQAIRLNPKDAEAYYNRGNAYRRLKQDPAALNDYSAAIKLNPDDARSYTNRGSILFDARRYEAA